MSQSTSAVAACGLEGDLVVRHDPVAHRLAVRDAHERGDRGADRVAHLARSEARGVGGYDLVARRDDRDPGTAPDSDTLAAGGRERRDLAHADRASRRGEHGSDREVVVLAHDVLARQRAARDAHAVGRGRIRVLDHHDGVGAVRERAAGRDRERGAVSQRGRRGLAHPNRPDDLERCRQLVARVARIGGHHRVPVDGGSCEAGKGRGSQHVRRRHAPEHVVHCDGLDRGSPGRAEGVESLLDPPHAGRLGHDRAV